MSSSSSSSMQTPRLPLGAVRTEDGEVVVPASVRADGSVRKPVRIRQGYVPQDEMPRYRPPPRGSRAPTRENNAKEPVRTPVQANDEAGDEGEELASELAALTLTRGQAERESNAKPRGTPAARAPQDQRALKNELSGIKKLLREITRLEAFAAAAERGNEGARPLTSGQRAKVERKHDATTRQRAIIAQLNGTESAAASSRSEPPVPGPAPTPAPGRGKHPNTLRTIEM